ncbi:hypothetical protein HKO22_03010 [Peptoniphilus sp. AGMB00490]|uniref:Uncharacterized protein n=1 Tax=Peptoniphilus faecalis TaxID=2731255 RepID=A0A848RKQ2_9FIRM|nr:hypothetical protein [Peptoniphilus faecalis]NMW84714.1 hypothetical protein [Peptoniphilus faecalis]
MKLRVSFDVDIPNEKLEQALLVMGYRSLIDHARNYLNKTVTEVFHRQDKQEISNIKMSIVKL